MAQTVLLLWSLLEPLNSPSVEVLSVMNEVSYTVIPILILTGRMWFLRMYCIDVPGMPESSDACTFHGSYYYPRVVGSILNLDIEIFKINNCNQ